jgi:VCBS repeat-containing protein
VDNGDTLTFSLAPDGAPANGTVTFNQADGTFTFTPNDDFEGTDSFTIRTTDSQGEFVDQVVTATVNPVNDAPTAPATNEVTTNEDMTSAPVAIGAMDVDNGDTLTFSLAPGGAPANGTVTFNQADGTFTFTPNENFNGTDSFTIRTTDSAGAFVDQVVVANVTPVNDAPVAVDDRLADVAEDSGPRIISAAELLANDRDVDGDALTVSAVGNAIGGTVTRNPDGSVTFTPATDFFGVASFEYTVSDGNGGTDTGLATFNVTPVTDTRNGTEGPDTINGDDGKDIINGLGGNDIINGFGEDDTLRGGDGDDVIDGGAGNDRIEGGNGDDRLTGGTGDDVVLGGAGNDRIFLQDGGDDIALGGSGDDRFFLQGALTSADKIIGGAGFDTVNLEGNYPDLVLEADTFDGIENIRITNFDAADNNYRITTVDETVEAGELLRVDARDLGAGESLTFDGSRETDGTFLLLGGSGGDVLIGGAGDDQLFGFDGNDVLVGGRGTDQLRGGRGNDIFQFNSVEDSSVGAPDTIADFQKGFDKIDLTRIDANSTTPEDDAFTFIGDAAFTGTAGQLRSVFDANTGQNRVEGDVDGDGVADFAILVNIPNPQPLVAGDFFL